MANIVLNPQPDFEQDSFAGPLHGSVYELPNAPGSFMEGAVKKIVYGPDRFLPDYVMRCWVLSPGGGERSTHQHPWPHWVVCIRGETANILGEERFTMKAGDWEFIPGGVEHCFWNNSDSEECAILCMVPPEGDVPPGSTHC